MQRMQRWIASGIKRGIFMKSLFRLQGLCFLKDANMVILLCDGNFYLVNPYSSNGTVPTKPLLFRVRNAISCKETTTSRILLSMRNFFNCSIPIGKLERRDTNWSTIFFEEKYWCGVVCFDGFGKASDRHAVLLSGENNEFDKKNRV